MGEGGGALTKRAVMLKKAMEVKDMEKPWAGGVNGESQTEWAKAIRGSGLPKHDSSN